MFSWFPWIITGGTLTWIALAIFAPHVLSILTPILKAVVEGIIELIKRLWDGFLDVVDNINTIIFVIAACLAWAWYSKEPPKVVYKERPVASKKVAPAAQQKKENPAFSLQGWEWFHR